jgi:hypothetical protein
MEQKMMIGYWNLLVRMKMMMMMLMILVKVSYVLKEVVVVATVAGVVE